MQIQDLRGLLRVAAENHVSRGLTVYPLGNTERSTSVKYSELLFQAQCNSRLLSRLDGFTQGSVVLLHLDSHLDSIIWFWSVVYANGIPAMSTPFTRIPEQREKHIGHLHNLLNDPICITRLSLLDTFGGKDVLKLHTVESLCSTTDIDTKPAHIATAPESTDLALLMFTSGSTGSTKAVCLSNSQILTAITGKASVRMLPSNHTFLNWVGLDHVAGMVEIHLQAIYLNVDQVHVQASDVISNPSAFLNLISRHRVSRTFAPNFFLTKIRQALEPGNAGFLDSDLDLSCLHFLASGGEANVVETCNAVSKLLNEYGAPRNAIVSGFGMTETCAGAIFNLDCPSYDLRNGYEFASLGMCMAGIRMRVTVPDKDGILATFDEPGSLELSGDVVFKGYYNNPSASADAFTQDGWFLTGDQAMIDTAGNLNLLGRTKEIMNVNGLKYLPHELEATIDEAMILGVTPSYIVCFPYRLHDMQTEQICVVYVPTYAADDTKARVEAQNSIIKVVMLQTGVRPSVLPIDRSLLQKSTLGKLSRAKTRTTFERGDYRAYVELNDVAVQAHRSEVFTWPANETERLLLAVFRDSLELSGNEFGVETPVFEMGVTSIDLIKLKRQTEKVLSINEIPVATMLTHLTVRSLVTALQELNVPKRYNPVVTLQPHGRKTPLWLFHPGVGEVLVFLNLAKYLTDRPVYALRARGFDNGDPYFYSITEAVGVYHAAIKAQQARGPYALAGYSYGTMLAFEVAKLLERDGEQVRFLASFNLPPHIKARMKLLNWTQCLLHLSYFLGLITENFADAAAPKLENQPRANALAYVVQAAERARLVELSLTAAGLANWVDLAFGLQSMAREYDPSGSVAVMDVFYATPLKVMGFSRKEWLEGHLRRWEDFVREDVEFHEVGGAHYTLIGPEFVGGFQKKLRMVLRSRGL